MSIIFFKPKGFYLPLIWYDYRMWSRPYFDRLIILTNIFLRILFYPFIFAINAIITGLWVTVATFFNLGCLFGGYFSSDWSNKAKYFNQISIIRCQWLLFDVFVFIWYQLKLIRGFFDLKYGIDTIEFLQKLNVELKTKLFDLDGQASHYNAISRLKYYFYECSMYVIGNVVCSLSAEPAEAIYFGFKMMQGMGKNLHKFGLNPTEITESQAKYQPVLLLHGNLHNQSAWLPLAEFLYHKKYQGPVFTVNLPSLEITEADYEIINNKVYEIMDLYARQNEFDVKITVIGHSRGALLADDYYEKSLIINKAIIMGNPGMASSYDHKSYGRFFISGRKDILCKVSDDTRGTLVDAGHLGLIANQEALEECYNILNNTPIMC